jgi:Holliday junction resolvase
MASTGRGSRVKGASAERAFVRQFLDAGILAEKVSRSGYSTHDLTVTLNAVVLKVESKDHSNGFKRLYGWLKPVHMLIVKANYQEPLAVLRLSQLIALLRPTEKP